MPAEAEAQVDGGGASAAAAAGSMFADSALEGTPGLEDVSIGGGGGMSHGQDVVVGQGVPMGEAAMRDARSMLRRRESFKMMQRKRSMAPGTAKSASATGT